MFIFAFTRSNVLLVFKGYLYIRSKGFQLSVFLFIWAGFFLISQFLQLALIRQLYNVPAEDMADFLSSALLKHPDFMMFFNALFTLLAFGVPAFLFAYLAHPRPAGYLGLQPIRNLKQWPWILMLVVGMIPVLMTIGGYINTLNLGETAHELQQVRESQINAYLKDVGGWELLRNVLCLAVLPAFCEEALFRGVIQKFAFSYTKSISWTIVISALSFALMHMSVYDFLPIFLAGLLLAWVYQQTACLWLNIVVHFLFNGSQLVIAFYAARNESFSQAGQHAVYLVIATLACLLLLWLALVKLYHLRTPFTKRWGVEEPEKL
ncbi:MAG TPA: type II CAAX endopeptidase family protein [Edaphocola sp.]|nr:type II CAAX endopeptidase family protein [Edaphocola sp.]